MDLFIYTMHHYHYNIIHYKQINYTKIATTSRLNKKSESLNSKNKED